MTRALATAFNYYHCTSMVHVMDTDECFGRLNGALVPLTRWTK